MCSVYTANSTRGDGTANSSHSIVCYCCLERQTDCYHQPSSIRRPVKVPLCHVGPWGHSLALGCQRWAAIWIPATSSPAAPWRLTALTDQKRVVQERAFWVRRFLKSNTPLRLLYFLWFVKFSRHQCRGSSVHDLQHAKSSAIASSFTMWKRQAVKGYYFWKKKKKKVALINTVSTIKV